MKIDTKHHVSVFTIETWDDFEHFCEGCGPVVFRGQSDSTWDLTTNYEREFGASSNTINVSRESSMLHRCIAEGHLYISDCPASDDWVSWLAEMQHYGASTRLLDVTRSKYIALFFALTGMKAGDRKDGAVWAFDVAKSDKVLYGSLQKSLGHVIVDHMPAGFGEGILPYQDIGWRIANSAVGYEPAGKITVVDKTLTTCRRILNRYYRQGMIVHVMPKRINRRLQAQQGEFLFPFNIARTFVQNLLGPIGGLEYKDEICMFGNVASRKQARVTTSPVVLKAVIPFSLRDEFMDRLIERNISYQTLFPDEFGFMKSLQFQRNRHRLILKMKKSKGKGLRLSVNEFDL